MGKEWLQWMAAAGRRRRSSPEKDESSSAGCMCAVFQLFDLQHHPFSYQPDGPFLQQEATSSSKGVEAPRNSLELDEPIASMKVASSLMSLAIKHEEDNSNFPVGINQIKTRVASKSKTEDNNNFSSSDCSPGTAKTPNLVARLMGLDLLPECNSNNSPSFSCPNPKPKTKSHFNPKTDTSTLQTRSRKCFSDDDIAIGARSSSARKSDIEYHHRLSLQINKDNSGNDEFAISAKMRGRSSPKSENSSPARHFARQIVNQVKEKVSRRAGLADITNTNSRDKGQRRDQNLVLCQPTKKSLETKKKLVTSSVTKSPRNSNSSCDGNYYHQSQSQQGFLKDGKKLAGAGNGNRDVSSSLKKLQLAPQTYDYSIKNPKLEKKKKSKTLGPLMSSEIVNISGPTVFPVKKDPSPPATKLPQKQSQVSDALSSKRNTQLSRKSSRSYKQTDNISAVPEKIALTPNGGATATSVAPEYRDYVHKILKRAGINDRLTPLTLGKWHTSSHPLDPSIFYYLELFHPSAAVGGGALSRRSSRKLIFQLVNELLAEILKPHLDFKPWVDFSVGGLDRFGLCDEICRKIGDFPAADCRVLEDIDFLIERDLCRSELSGFFAAEGEGLVREIEGEILEGLVLETVAAVVGGGRTEKEKKKTESRQVSRAGQGCHVMRCY